MDKKVERIINIYNRLSNGEVLVKSVEASRFEVNERSIQRDLDDIRAFFANNPEMKIELVYDRVKKGYKLVGGDRNDLTSCEILIVCKILLESRVLTREEMTSIIDKLVKYCVPHEDYKRVSELISNEKFHYLEPENGMVFRKIIWDISLAINNHYMMSIETKESTDKLNTYKDNTDRVNTDKVNTEIHGQGIKIRPVGIMFSENYFHLYAFVAEGDECDAPRDIKPVKFRLDLIEKYKILSERFSIVYAERFELGKYRHNL